MTAPYRITRSANGRQWDIVDAAGRIIEGGFFARAAAEAALADIFGDDANDAYASEYDATGREG